MSTSTEWEQVNKVTFAAIEKAYTEAWFGGSAPPSIISAVHPWLTPREKSALNGILPLKTVEAPSQKWIDRFTPYDNKQLIWTPPPGTFPEPEPKPEVIIPNSPPQHVGRWLCSVRAIVREGEPQYWSFSSVKNRIWIEAAPDVDDGRSTRQTWVDYEGDWTDSVRSASFEKFVQEIEQAPDCCSKHKILMQPYDGSKCVGKRKHSPPPALMPPEKHEATKGWRFGIPGYKKLQSELATSINWFASNVSVPSPRTGFKLHRFDVVTDPAAEKNSLYWIGQKVSRYPLTFSW
jgi:hypothetical protein